eukprot:9281-Heterococcus_DN1.PRE.2
MQCCSTTRAAQTVAMRSYDEAAHSAVRHTRAQAVSVAVCSLAFILRIPPTLPTLLFSLCSLITDHTCKACQLNCP